MSALCKEGAGPEPGSHLHFTGRRGWGGAGPFFAFTPAGPGVVLQEGACVTSPATVPSVRRGLCGWVLRGAPRRGAAPTARLHGNLRRREPGRLQGVRLPSSLDGCLVYSAVSLQSLLSLTPIPAPLRGPQGSVTTPASAPAVRPRCTPAPG